MSLPGAVLVAAAPYRPGVSVGPVAAGFGDDGAAELSQQLRDGDGDQPEDAGVFVAGPLEGGGHSEEDIGEQADRGPAVPGGPGGDLAAVQPADLLGLLVVFLDGLITNGKFCCVRRVRLSLGRWHRPLRLRGSVLQSDLALAGEPDDPGLDRGLSAAGGVGRAGQRAGSGADR